MLPAVVESDMVHASDNGHMPQPRSWIEGRRCCALKCPRSNTWPARGLRQCSRAPGSWVFIRIILALPVVPTPLPARPATALQIQQKCLYSNCARGHILARVAGGLRNCLPLHLFTPRRVGKCKSNTFLKLEDQMKASEFRRYLASLGATFVEGTKHTKVYLNGKQTTLPRHGARELGERLRRAILRQLGVK